MNESLTHWHWSNPRHSITLQAAVVINVTDAGGTDIVHFSMGELCAFNIHFSLLSAKGKRRNISNLVFVHLQELTGHEEK